MAKEEGVVVPMGACAQNKVLFCAQLWQAATNSPVSFSSEGHQNLCLWKPMVRHTPGWQLSLEECSYCRTLERRIVGTKRRLGGQSLGGCAPFDLTLNAQGHQTPPRRKEAKWK